MLRSDVTGRHVLRVDLWVPVGVAKGLVPWKKSRAVGELLARLLPATPQSARDAAVCPLCGASDAADDSGLSALECAHSADASACIACGAPGGRSAAQRPHESPYVEPSWLQASSIAASMLTPARAGDVATGAPAPPFQFKLCVLQLPNWLLEAPALPPPPPAADFANSGDGVVPQRSQLAHLPREVLQVLLGHCSDVSALACTCR